MIFVRKREYFRLNCPSSYKVSTSKSNLITFALKSIKIFPLFSWKSKVSVHQSYQLTQIIPDRTRKASIKRFNLDKCESNIQNNSQGAPQTCREISVIWLTAQIGFDSFLRFCCFLRSLLGKLFWAPFVVKHRGTLKFSSQQFAAIFVQPNELKIFSRNPSESSTSTVTKQLKSLISAQSKFHSWFCAVWPNK
jgi:hypothetical protein